MSEDYNWSAKRNTVVLYFIRYWMMNKRAISLFLLVGALSAGIYFFSFTVLWKLMNVNYKVAVSIAYMISVVVHFTINRKLTFQSSDTHFLLQMPRYLTMILINYIITLGITRVIVETCHMSPYLGIFCSIGVTINVSYLLLRFWVFPPTA